MISIIIPTYNRAHLISRAVDSVVNQTFKKWELIIVDDGSTDNTKEIIQPFLSDNRIKLIEKENTGAAHSRNIGVEKSNFEWLTFLDSDDEAKDNWLFEVTQLIQRTDAQLISCGCEKYNHHGELVEKKLPNKNTNLFGEVRYKMTNGGVFFLRKEDFLKIGGFDKDLKSGQHTELSFRLIPLLQKRNASIIALEDCLIKVHMHKGERIRTNPKMKYEGAFYSLTKHKAFFSERPKAKAKYEAIVGVNAFKLKLYKVGFKNLINSFITKPTINSFLRILKYTFSYLFKKNN
ncbi:glycosyl transferase [Marivirga lumbricoides]|uniref:Glycosyl transferase n=1 Tax=Marivirga lumbricoides TaxID=1046115 RepID=A0ABQ1LR40_9BACT|nr:glycosyl transferase [Marivirga lumbricoides]